MAVVASRHPGLLMLGFGKVGGDGRHGRMDIAWSIFVGGSQLTRNRS